MRHAFPSSFPWFAGLLIASFTFGYPLASAQSIRSRGADRAAPPEFRKADWQKIFFADLSDAFRGARPSVSQLRERARSEPSSLSQSNFSGDEATVKERSLWAGIDASSVEDEIKRVRLEFDRSITTPSAFRGGGYQDARLHLSILATLFAAVHQWNGDIRWKEEAAAARDILSRTAHNASTGTIQVYNEAKRRKADLQDLMSGAGLAGRPGDPANDWSSIADRSVLMSYSERVLDKLTDQTASDAKVQADVGDVIRNADMLALIGIVLRQEGMDEADDGDYVALSVRMTDAAGRVKAAIGQQQWSDVRKHVGEVSQSCIACHDQYR